MKLKISSILGPTASGFVAGLLCCLPAGDLKIQFPIAITDARAGAPTSFQARAPRGRGLPMNSAATLANAVRGLLRGAQKAQRCRRRATENGLQQEIHMQSSSGGRGAAERIAHSDRVGGSPMSLQGFTPLPLTPAANSVRTENYWSEESLRKRTREWSE